MTQRGKRKKKQTLENFKQYKAQIYLQKKKKLKFICKKEKKDRFKL